MVSQSNEILFESEDECGEQDSIIETPISIGIPPKISTPEHLSSGTSSSVESSRSTIKKSFKRGKDVSLSEVNKVAYEYFSNKKKIVPGNSDIEDPDLNFLKSILLDMKLMTDNQKWFFKIGILNLTTKILQPLPTGQHTSRYNTSNFSTGIPNN